MAQLDAAIYRCRNCRFGPRSNRDGWTDADYEAMWTITPGAEISAIIVGGMTLPISHDVVPCDAHRQQLEQDAKERV